MFWIKKDGVRGAYPDTFSGHLELADRPLLIDPDLVAVDFLHHGKPPLPDFARYGRTVV